MCKKCERQGICLVGTAEKVPDKKYHSSAEGHVTWHHEPARVEISTKNGPGKR